MSYLKVGFLAGVGGNRTGIGDYFRKVAEAGRPIIITSYDDFGIIAEAVRIADDCGVPCHAAFRPTLYDGPAYRNPDYSQPRGVAFTDYYNAWRSKIPSEAWAYKDTVWFVWGNEGRKEKEWANWWGNGAVQFATAAKRDGLRTLAFGWSAGTPEHDCWQQQGMLAYLKLCNEHPDWHGLAVHEGADPRADNAPYASLLNNVGHITGRYRTAFAECDARGWNRPNVYITECAWKYNDAPDMGWAMADIATVNDEYLKDPEVKGVALWYLGGGGQYGNVADKVQKLIAPVTTLACSDKYDGAIEPPTEPEPPTPQPQPGTNAWLDLSGRAIDVILHAPFDTVPASEAQTIREWAANGIPLANGSKTGGRHTSTPSLVDAMYLVRHGSAESRLFIVGRSEFVNSLGNAWFHANGVPDLVERTVRVKLPEPDLPPTTGDTTLGIDVSQFQQPAQFNAPLAISKGFRFAYVRASAGLARDSQLDAWVALLRSHGFLVGAYHWISPSADGALQAAFFARTIADLPLDLPPAFDVEKSSLTGQAPAPEKVRTTIERFRQTVTKPIIYTGVGAWNEVMGRGHEWAGDYDLWVANYTTAPQPALPYPWQTWHIWQYDSKPNVLQSMHALDVNRFNGDVDALKAWAASYKKTDGAKPWRYVGEPVPFTPAIHGPGHDGAWLDNSFRGMMGRFRDAGQAMLWMSHGINLGHARAYGNPLKDVVRLYWSPRAHLGAADIWREIRDDQLRGWYDAGWRKFHFFNEPQVREEGFGEAWQSAEAFAALIGQIVGLARAEFHDLQIGTTPMTPSIDVDRWRQAQWSVLRGAVDFYCAHAYTGNNDQNAALQACNDVIEQVSAMRARYDIQIPFALTEFSVNRGGDMQQKANVYRLIEKRLAAMPGVQFAAKFISIWTPDPHHESFYGTGLDVAYLEATA